MMMMIRRKSKRRECFIIHFTHRIFTFCSQIFERRKTFDIQNIWRRFSSNQNKRFFTDRNIFSWKISSPSSVMILVVYLLRIFLPYSNWMVNNSHNFHFNLTHTLNSIVLYESFIRILSDFDPLNLLITVYTSMVFISFGFTLIHLYCLCAWYVHDYSGWKSPKTTKPQDKNSHRKQTIFMKWRIRLFLCSLSLWNNVSRIDIVFTYKTKRKKNHFNRFNGSLLFFGFLLLISYFTILFEWKQIFLFCFGQV